MSEDIKNLQKLYTNVNSILKKINVSEIDPNQDFEKLPDGYYLSEVVSLDVCESKAGNLQVKGQFKIVENGIGVSVDDDGDSELYELKNTKGKVIFKYYSMKDETFVTRLIKDMLKFEGEEEGKPLLSEEYFTDIEIMKEALSILSESRIYIQLSTSKNKETGESNQNSNLLSWKRVKSLGLLD